LFLKQILALTSNFGEAPILETTTRREVESASPSVPASASTEFYPSQTHNINFDFDADPQQVGGIDPEKDDGKSLSSPVSIHLYKPKIKQPRL
jgi:hypothetical protein